MEDIAERHSQWVANFLVGKVKEFHHYLRAIVNACDQSLQLFCSERRHEDWMGPAVIYAFSSFSNATQSLKDILPTLTGQPIAWREIRALRHGTFLSQTRNAATHDGNPIINAWADGLFFIGSDIQRLDDKRRLVHIQRPTEDVRTICLQFARDFAGLLQAKLRSLDGRPPIRGAVQNLTEIDEAMSSDHIPEIAKRLFAQNREEISQQLANVRHYPVEVASVQLEVLVRYCDERLRSISLIPEVGEQIAAMLGPTAQQNAGSPDASQGRSDDAPPR